MPLPNVLIEYPNSPSSLQLCAPVSRYDDRIALTKLSDSSPLARSNKEIILELGGHHEQRQEREYARKTNRQHQLGKKKNIKCALP